MLPNFEKQNSWLPFATQWLALGFVSSSAAVKAAQTLTENPPAVLRLLKSTYQNPIVKRPPLFPGWARWAVGIGLIGVAAYAIVRALKYGSDSDRENQIRTFTMTYPGIPETVVRSWFGNSSPSQRMIPMGGLEVRASVETAPPSAPSSGVIEFLKRDEEEGKPVFRFLLHRKLTVGENGTLEVVLGEIRRAIHGEGPCTVEVIRAEDPLTLDEQRLLREELPGGVTLKFHGGTNPPQPASAPAPFNPHATGIRRSVRLEPYGTSGKIFQAELTPEEFMTGPALSAIIVAVCRKKPNMSALAIHTMLPEVNNPVAQDEISKVLLRPLRNTAAVEQITPGRTLVLQVFVNHNQMHYFVLTATASGWTVKNTSVTSDSVRHSGLTEIATNSGRTAAPSMAPESPTRAASPRALSAKPSATVPVGASSKGATTPMSAEELYAQRIAAEAELLEMGGAPATPAESEDPLDPLGLDHSADVFDALLDRFAERHPSPPHGLSIPTPPKNDGGSGKKNR